MKQNINIEAEGNELILKNKAGDYVIIPKKYRLEVQDMIKDGCHSCVDKVVETLPVMSDYAEDGTLIGKIKGSKLNPKNWGVPDYTDKGSRGAAYAAARKAGEKEFMWNNQRFNTKYDGTPEQQLKETGITDEQIGGKRSLKRVYKNTTPYTSYTSPLIQGLSSYLGFEDRYRDINVEDPIPVSYYLEGNSKPFIDLSKEEQKKYKELSKPYFKRAEDAWALYTGNPQRFETFEISKYKPSTSKNKDTYYYSLNKSYPELLDFVEKEGVNLKYGESKQVEEPTRLVLRNFKIGKSKDERGEYISYYDTWNLNPSFEFPLPEQGKPFEIYDRIYVKDYGDGQKKRMYYSDKELSELDIDKKNFDTLALQRELSNRGYKLPKSTREDGTFDGIWGDETKNALLDYQTKNKPVMNNYAESGPLIPKDKKKITLEHRPYTAVQDNTYVTPKVVIPLELKKKQQFVPREQPVLKPDTRTDRERKIAQEYTESVLNPSISTQIGEALQKPLRWIADPVKGVGDIVSVLAPNSALAKDLPNTNEETFEHRKKQLNPYISNKEKINTTINEAIPLTNWALLNTLPVEAAAGNMVKSGKNLIKPVSKVVGKTDDVTKAGSKVLNKTDDVIKNSSKFKSEIDWGKWNKEIPNNSKLMKEYNAIEKASKANGTWMKNPDGSAFKGTPEQFVQQNSKNFKKAFPNVLRDEIGNVQKTYHGSQNTFDFFDPNIMMTGRTRGEGIYTSPIKERAATYATKGDKKLYEFYQNASNPQLKLEEFNKASDIRFNKFLQENPKGSKGFDKKFDEFMKNEDKLFDKLTDEEYFKLQPGYDFYKASGDEYVVPFTNYPKSAIGNNGMFDMTNPNIYKGIIPPALLLYLQSQNKDKQ